MVKAGLANRQAEAPAEDRSGKAYLRAKACARSPPQAGGEISRAAMVLRDCGRPRSCARGAENGAGYDSNDDDPAAGHPARGIRQGRRGRAAARSDRPPDERTAMPPTWPSARPTTTGQGLGFAAKGDRGPRPVAGRHPAADRLARPCRSSPRRPTKGALPGDKMATPSGWRAERIRIAGIGAPQTQRRQARRRFVISLGKAAIAHARTWLDGRNVTIMRVGRGR